MEVPEEGLPFLWHQRTIGAGHGVVEVERGSVRSSNGADFRFLRAVTEFYRKVRAFRAAAIAEICRVLKPGGTALIVDIRHIRQYAAALRAGGCTVRRAGSDLGTKVLMIISLGLVRPGNVIARKDAQLVAGGIEVPKCH